MTPPPAHLLLLQQITQCSSVLEARGSAGHPCSAIVATQQDAPDLFQVPEPWAGHLETAPLLFVSSNPSISDTEPYPRWSSTNEDRVAFFTDRFGDGERQVKDGVYAPLSELLEDGRLHTRRPVVFWNICKRNATWLYGRTAVPGSDYAMTEVVHCKSRREIGVADARDHCSKQWLMPVLDASAARVVVLLGEHARQAFSQQTGMVLDYWVPQEFTSGGRSRRVLLARHPNYRGRRRWSDHLAGARQQLQTALLGSPRN